MSESLDAIDLKILDLIQQDAGISVAEIADKVGLSTSPCWRRIKRLEESGIILSRVTRLDRHKMGMGFEVYATVKLSQPSKENLETFEKAVLDWPEIIECAVVSGEEDYFLRIITRDMHSFDKFVRETVLSLGLVSNIQSRIVFSSVKDTTALPLHVISDHED